MWRDDKRLAICTSGHEFESRSALFIKIYNNQGFIFTYLGSQIYFFKMRFNCIEKNLKSQ